MICKNCGTDLGTLSHNSLCPNCAVKKMNDNIKQLKSKKGIYFQKYKKGMKRYIDKL